MHERRKMKDKDEEIVVEKRDSNRTEEERYEMKDEEKETGVEKKDRYNYKYHDCSNEVIEITINWKK